MKKSLYILLPLIALTLIVSNAWSAKAPQPDDNRPGMKHLQGPSTALPPLNRWRTSRTSKGRGDKGGPSTKLPPLNRWRTSRAGSKLGIPRGRWWKRSHVQEKLNLTDKQIKKLEKISLEGRKNMIRARADLEIAELGLEPLMEAKDFDRDKVEDVLGKMESTRAKMAKERIKTLLDTREVLTGKQYQKLKEMKDRNRVHRGSGDPSAKLRTDRHSKLGRVGRRLSS